MLPKVKCSFSMYSHVLLMLVVNSCVNLVQTGPVPHPHPYYKAPDSNRLEAGNHSLTSPKQPQPSKLRIGGCRYQASVYSSGDLIPIEEPCLNCQCKNTAVVCKLRICPDTQVPPPGCILVHKANKCCAQIVCPENNKKISREHRLAASGDIANGTLMNSLALPDDKGFCVYEGTVYAEGSAMRSSSLCEHCFCIRGEMKCSSPQCVIPLDGCKPRFRSYACCPTNYDCNDSNSTAIIKTTPASTPIPQFLKGCQVSGRFVREGEPVLPLNLEPDAEINPCQTCFCMGGVVRCRPLECDKPLHGCRPIIKPGHCCPDRYECPMNATAFNQVVMESLVSPGVVLNSGELASNTNRNRVLTSTEIHAPLALDQNTVNEILSSRIANSLKEQQPPAAAATEPTTTTSTNQPHTTVASTAAHDAGSREDRRNKDAHDYVIKISRELIDADDHEHSDNGNGASSSKSMSIDMIPETHVIGQLSDLLIHNEHSLDNNSSDGDIDGDELTIALEVITENDMGETTGANNLSIITTTEAVITTLPIDSDVDLDQNVVHVHADDEEAEIETTTIASSPEPQSTEMMLPALLPSSNWQPQASASGDWPTDSPAAEELVEDAQRTTLTPAPEPEPDSSTSAHEKLESVQEATATAVGSSSSSPSSLGNLEFIPFGVEDVMLLKDDHLAKKGNEHNPPLSDPHVPIKITFDSTDTRKASLIAPSPQHTGTGFVHVPLLHQHQPEHFADDDSSIITHAKLVASIMNDHKNVVFDVPVSTSLYNNGYFPNTHRLVAGGLNLQNKSIFDHVFEDSSEKRFEFEDEVDDEKDEEIANGRSENTTTITSELNTTSDLLEDKTPRPPEARPHSSTTEAHASSSSTTPSTTTSTSPPSRIYSKFDINDSPYYNRFGEAGYDLAASLPGQPALKQPSVPAAVTTKPGTAVSVDHHRYYEGPELTKDALGFYPFADYTSTSENDEADNEEDEFVVYEEQDSESHEHEHGHSDFREPSFSSKLEKIMLATFPASSSTSKPMASNAMKPASVAPKKKPQYYSRTPASTIKPIVVNTPRPSAPASGSSSTLIFSPAHGSGGFKPVLSFPFVPFPKNKPLDALLHIGLKLSGCNIYGKMYGIGNIIRELSSSCIQCQCTEIGVQCSEIICDGEDMIMMS